jgi:hypothetical protein
MLKRTSDGRRDDTFAGFDRHPWKSPGKRCVERLSKKGFLCHIPYIGEEKE